MLRKLKLYGNCSIEYKGVKRKKILKGAYEIFEIMLVATIYNEIHDCYEYIIMTFPSW